MSNTAMNEQRPRFLDIDQAAEGGHDANSIVRVLCKVAAITQGLFPNLCHE